MIIFDYSWQLELVKKELPYFLIQKYHISGIYFHLLRM